MVGDEEAPPFLSIIIAVYNREQLVLRAIASALAHSARDFEVVVVDDGSADGTAAAVAAVTDSRVRLIRLPANSGQCIARNRGAEAATGRWLVFLDSDDELAPHALDAIRTRARNAPANVAKLLFACLDDFGKISPDPASTGETIDYVGYLHWLERTSAGASEALPTTRRDAFLQCPYPEQRTSSEGIHELDFVKRHSVQLCPEVVRLYHYDAPNRLMTANVSTLVTRADGFARHAEATLARHGAPMREHAPTRWSTCVRESALYNLLAGKRALGTRRALRSWMSAPLDVKAAALVACAWMPPRMLAGVKARWSA